MKYWLKSGFATRIAGMIHQLEIDPDSKFIWMLAKNICPCEFTDIFLPNDRIQNNLEDPYTILGGPPVQCFDKAPPDPELMSKILNENCVFKPIIVNLANQYPTNNKTLGLHIRCYNVKCTRDLEMKRMEAVDKKLDEEFETIFVASDVAEIKDFYVKRYGKRALYIPHNHFNRQTVHAMYVAAGDMLCLSRCGFLYKSNLYFSYISSLFQMIPSQKGLQLR